MTRATAIVFIARVIMLLHHALPYADRHNEPRSYNMVHYTRYKSIRRLYNTKYPIRIHDFTTTVAARLIYHKLIPSQGTVCILFSVYIISLYRQTVTPQTRANFTSDINR